MEYGPDYSNISHTGTAVRECGLSSTGDGLWAAPDFELCADPVYTELVKNVSFGFIYK